MNNLQAKQQKSKRNLLLHVVPLVAATSPLVLFFQPAFAANTLTTLVNFKGSNGANPAAGIFIGTDGNIYGTTSLGGTKNKGTVFKLSSPSFTTLTTLVNFSGATGAKPVARLFQNSDGNLYGSTNLGGTSNLGTIFRLTSPTFTTLKTLANFNGTNGANPAGRLILGSDSRLWGTTTAGGSANLGTIFKVPLAGGSPTVVVSFKGT
ncbi:MAG TPA: choice-of-anchor tandem repeat GloVer-containing protein, partial [Stenomitos sp.]